MAEELIISQSNNKEEKYRLLLPQIKSLLEGETDLIARVANAMAAIKNTFNFLWVGVYFIKEDELVLGPFQGPIACTRIKKGKGVCGESWQEEKTLIVADVNSYPNHIACSSLSQSEIVVPFYHNGEIKGVLDIDSDQLNTFDEFDKNQLEQLVKYFYS